MSFIETDWDKIIKETALNYYKKKNVQNIVITDIDFLNYSELVTAVSSMVVKKDVVVCTSKCSEIVTKMWKSENNILKEKKGDNFVHQELSAIKPIIEGLLKASDFRDKKDNPITTIEKTNFLVEKDTGFISGKAKPVLTGGGLTQRSKQQWRKEVTRRVQQARLEKI